MLHVNQFGQVRLHFSIIFFRLLGVFPGKGHDKDAQTYLNVEGSEGYRRYIALDAFEHERIMVDERGTTLCN